VLPRVELTFTAPPDGNQSEGEDYDVTVEAV
jgi:hypothetical protein